MTYGKLPYKHFTRCRVGILTAIAGIVEAEMATYLHPAALQWAPGSNSGAQHTGDLPPLTTQWHEVGSRSCATCGGKMVASIWQLEARTSQA